MGDRIIKKTNRYLLAIFIDHKNIVRPIKPLVTAETDCNHTYHDYMKPMQKKFPPKFSYFTCRYKGLTNGHNTRRDIRKKY